jgi:hypothetical protein
MAFADVVAYNAAMKEVWTQDTVELNFYADDPLLDKIQTKFPSNTIGEYGVTPIHTDRAGGFSVVPSTGSSELNEPTNQGLAQAQWKWTRQWKRAKIDTAAVIQTQGSANAVVETNNMEAEGAISDLRKQVTRQAFGNGDALIAQTAANTTTNTIKLTAGSAQNGFNAVRNGHLWKGLRVDIGTTASQSSVANNVEVTAVNNSETEPSITVSGSAITTTTSHFVSIHGARSGTTSFEMNGLKNIVSETSELGGLNPTTVPKWAAARVKNEAGNQLSIPKITQMQRAVRQNTGKMPDWALTSLLQEERVYNLLFTQVRYQQPNGMQAGDTTSLMVGQTPIDAHPDCPDGDFYFLTQKHFFALRNEKPYWVPQKFGSGDPWQYVPGTTFIESALEYFIQLGVNRRNAFAAYHELG